jgi:PPOX class probable FMN-dependent enzyme
MPQQFQRVIESQDDLRAVVGTPHAMAVDKAISEIDEHCAAFIARSPFMLLATSAASGRCDVSPKGDAPGFVHVLDSHTLAIPDRPGNRRADSLSNIVENGHAGLLFMVPGTDETLRVEGEARIVADPDLLESMADDGREPKLAVVVDVTSAFLHCAKCIRRSDLWETETWPDRSLVPSAGDMIRAATQIETPAAEIQAGYDESVKALY